MRDVNARRVLDLGCGTGALARRLASDGYSVTAIDSNPACIRAASRAGERAEFRCEDATRMEYVDAFDAVLVCMVLHTCTQSDRRSILRRAFGALRKGGRLLVVDVAAPRVRTWRGTLVRFLIEMEESAIGLLDAAHYRNFKDFVRHGGIMSCVSVLGADAADATPLRAGQVIAISLVRGA